MNLDLARRLIAEARASGSRHGLKPLSVVVLDVGGQVRAFEREDGSSNARFEIAFGKANGALALGIGSRALMARAEQQPYFIGAVAGAIGGALVPVPGGVIIQNADGEVIGAVGITGDTSDNDEAAAVDAIEAAGLVAVTG
ncbi:MAG TPA: heme-binding protein [Solirubrobacteraceae bacterium]|nr:heme-binding protein [Solirubrobacteraceae bacterium]